MITANMPMPSVKTATDERLMTGSRNKDNGISGSTALLSAHRNAKNITAETTRSASTLGDDQPYSVTQVNASSSGTMQKISESTPAQSIFLWTPCGRQYGK